jgi:serine-type D-Ala-D-Ala carboxypeptidase (penicillin-binding protein 5/6)
MRSSLACLAISIRAKRASLLMVTLIAGIAAAALAPSTAFARHRRAAPSKPSAAPAQSDALAGPYSSAVLMEPETGTVMFEKNSRQPWPTASLAKMMIAYIVAQKLSDGSLKLTDNITTSRKAAEMGGSQVYLKEGETFSLDEMMKAVMVHSANDSSVAVAEYVGGSTDGFVEMMNRQAAALGMKDTHYYSVHGLPPGPGQQADVSSAWDEALLASALVKYPQVMKWAAIDTAPFRNGSFELRNTNHLVRTFPGCDGLKTGFYYKAGFNVVATARRDGMRLIAVVLGSPRKGQNFTSAAELLAQGFANYRMRVVGKEGAPIAKAIVVDGGAVGSLQPVWGRDLRVLLKRNDDASFKINYRLPESVAAPIHAGQRLGEGQAVSGAKVIAAAPIVAPAAVGPQPPLLRRLFSML